MTGRTMWPAAREASDLPTPVEPVKVSARMTGEVSSRPEIWDGLPNSTLSTPGARPAARKAAARHRAVPGVSSSGLITTEQPAASAELILRDGVMSGAFHG